MSVNYQPYANHSCHSDARNKTIHFRPGTSLPPKNEEMLHAASSVHPAIAVAIDAGLQSFMLYTQGVYNDTACLSGEGDHLVAVVGYGVDAVTSGNYWILKNSWGIQWGEQGWMRLARGFNRCGVADQPTFIVAVQTPQAD